MTYEYVEGRWKTFRMGDEVIPLFPEPLCGMCAAPIDVSYEICYNCYSGDTQVDKINLLRIYAASVYISESVGHTVSEEIKKCKNDISCADSLAEVLDFAIKDLYPELTEYDLLVYPPRGETSKLNHLETIATKLSQRVRIPQRDLLFKITDYPSQRGLDRDNRIENVQDKIGCKNNVNNLRVVVVDDTCTTGATLLNSAKALKSKGAKEVVGLAIGRATNIKNLIYIGALREIKE
jgi:predicted amidophosphoribosyltransferase